MMNVAEEVFHDLVLQRAENVDMEVQGDKAFGPRPPDESWNTFRYWIGCASDGGRADDRDPIELRVLHRSPRTNEILII
jgi:hypothetical protein